MIRSIKFFIEGISHFNEVGTILRSTQKVANAMTDETFTNLSKASCIVELGAGDGSITSEILKKMPQDSTLLCFEINKSFAETLRHKFSHDKRITIINDDATKIGEYIQQAGYDCADTIISAIPFAIIPDDKIIEEAFKWLRAGQNFIQLHYSLSARKRYRRIFNSVNIKFIALNFPPVFLHICTKDLQSLID